MVENTNKKPSSQSGSDERDSDDDRDDKFVRKKSQSHRCNTKSRRVVSGRDRDSSLDGLSPESSAVLLELADQ